MHPIWKHVRTRAFAVALLPALLLAACDRGLTTAPVLADGPQLSSAAAVPTELFISEYIEGSSNNKALEIYNGTGAAVDLEAGDYNVQMYFNGSTSAGLTIRLAGTVASGDVFVLAHSSAVAAIRDQADLTNGAGWFNGDDAVVLRKGTTIIDVVGQIGVDPGSEWGSGLTSTADNTLRRVATICQGDTNGSDAFDPSLEWDGYAQDTFDGLGSHTADCGGGDVAPAILSTLPADGVTGFPVDGTIGITFSEPVTVSGDWFTISCTISGSRTASASGSSATWTLDPEGDFVGGESCTVTIVAAQVTDGGGNTLAADHSWSFTAAGGVACGDPYTATYTIQGSGTSTPIDKQTITTEGVVVGDYEYPGSGTASHYLRGFYLQDLTGDDDPLTSDGIFVFNGNRDNVKPGDVVRVTGTVGENFGQTQVSASSINVCGTGIVEPVHVTLPFPEATYIERFEGMLVRLPQTLYVTEHFQLGRFGEVVLSSGSRLMQPTSIAAPGAAAQAVQAQNDLNRIVIDDGLSRSNPDPILFGRGGSPLSASNTLRGGDHVTGIVGVLGYGFSAYRVQPVNALGGDVPNFVAANPRPSEPAPVKGALKVATMNLLNYFNTFASGCGNPAGGTSTDCRGADNAAEFERQWRKTVAAIIAMDVDVLGVVEVENDGYGPQSAMADLVNKLNAATEPGAYAFIDVDAATEQTNALGTDAIKVGLIYQPARVKPVGTTAVLNSIDFVNGGDGAPRNRPSLAQAFEQPNRARFIVSVNHFKSKGSACTAADAGDGQGNCNVVRTIAANELLKWLETDPTGTNDPDVLIVGDLNSYAKEDPITALISGGYTNLIESRVGPNAYSYAFDGQWGYLDHALASATLASQVTGVTEWHINADEPSVLDYNVNFKSTAQQSSLYSPDQYRVSDHDPVIVGLTLIAPEAKGSPRFGK